MAPYKHIVAFGWPEATAQSVRKDITREFLSLKEKCRTTNGERYISDIDGGRNISDEGAGHGCELVWTLTFDSEQDYRYYSDKDAEHLAFKEKVGASGMKFLTVFDYIHGEY